MREMTMSRRRTMTGLLPLLWKRIPRNPKSSSHPFPPSTLSHRCLRISSGKSFDSRFSRQRRASRSTRVIRTHGPGQVSFDFLPIWNSGLRRAIISTSRWMFGRGKTGIPSGRSGSLKYLRSQRMDRSELHCLCPFSWKEDRLLVYRPFPGNLQQSTIAATAPVPPIPTVPTPRLSTPSAPPTTAPPMTSGWKRNYDEMDQPIDALSADIQTVQATEAQERQAYNEANRVYSDIDRQYQDLKKQRKTAGAKNELALARLRNVSDRKLELMEDLVRLSAHEQRKKQGQE